MASLRFFVHFVLLSLLLIIIVVLLGFHLGMHKNFFAHIGYWGGMTGMCVFMAGLLVLNEEPLKDE